jgi:import inner membrane translocase subunit TIM10
MNDRCREKCIPKTYQDPELNKGEAVCARRCGSKLLAAVRLISTELSQLQQQQM